MSPSDTLGACFHAGMRQAGIKPSTVSYNSLLTACEHCGEADRALEIFGTMKREHEEHKRDSKPDTITYNMLISVCGKAGMFSEANELYMEMQQNKIRRDAVTLGSMVTACENVSHSMQQKSSDSLTWLNLLVYRTAACDC